MPMLRASSLCRDMARTIWNRRTIRVFGAFSTTMIHARRGRAMLEKIKADIEAAVPGCRVEIVPNGSPSGQRSLLLESQHAVEIARFLRDSAELRLDYCSNVSGVDWLDKETSEKVKVKTIVDGVEKEIDEVRKTQVPEF